MQYHGEQNLQAPFILSPSRMKTTSNPTHKTVSTKPKGIL